MSSMSRASSLPHSHSTPLSNHEGGSTTPRSTLSSSMRAGHPPTPLTSGGKKGGKIIEVKIITLDDSANLFQVQVKALGRVLFDQVCKQLNLLEADYFGLEYQDGQSRNWLDLEKPLHRQVGLSLVDPVLWFCVKFYTPDPSTQLEEEFTRFLFCLQIKRDLSQGLLHCNENTAALMASYIVQAECGDYVSEDYPDHTYLSSYKFVPNQSPELERRIMENHKKHAGQSPAAADLNLLETARRCELYGVRLHSARDHESILLNLSVAHMGILVFQNYTKINTFSWAKIRKISFKRKRFLIKLHPEGYGYYKDIVEFLFDNRNDCKNFWKKCVENHGFFRCSAVKNTPRQRTRVLSRGSSFRYSGKTQKQIVEFVRENYVKRQTFQRSQSFRNSNTLLSPSHGPSVGGEPALAAQPLLPITIDSPSLAAGATGPNTLRGEGHSLSYETWTHSSSGGKVYPAPARGKTREAFDEIQPDTVDIQNQNGGPAMGLNSRTGASVPGRKVSTSTLAGAKTTTLANQSSPITSPPHQEAAIVDVHDTTTTNSDLSSLSSNIPAPLGPADTTPAPAAAPIPTSTHPGSQFGSLGSRSLSSQLNGSPPPYSKSNHILANNNNHIEPKSLDSSPKVVILTNGNLSPKHNNNNNYENTRTGSDTGSLNRSLTGDSPLSNSNNRSSKRRHTADKSYFIIKELHMTERTFRKDLEVINLWFRDEVNKTDNSELLVDALDELFNLIDPLHDANCAFLRDIELKLSQWDNKAQQCIGDVMLKHLNTLPYFKAYMDRHVRILSDLDEAFHSSPKFQAMYTSFETAKVCFLPLSSFVLKPLHRLLQYHQILDKLIHYYNKDHQDYEDCFIAHQKLSHLVPMVTSLLRKSENLVQLSELDRDLSGSELRLSSDRTLVRIGCLAKFSQRRGYQQRMFLLYSDLLVYGIRSGPGFRVHAQLPLLHLSLEERADTPLQYSFQLYCAQRVITVAATSQEDKDRWLTDLSLCIDCIKQKSDTQDDSQLKYFSLKSTNSMDDVMDTKSSANGDTHPHSPLSPQRSNTTLHVCWHRNTSVSLEDALVCAQNQLSGYLLRKFKNSNGWQKLFLVFTNFCLFFYKTFQDDCPLASLPLIGYSVSTPSPQDGIAKDFVFKLTFKNHVYFFRAESEYTFQRWMSVIQAATRHTLHPPSSDAELNPIGGEDNPESCRL
uniref:FERM, RhoGEF and pleckstrin domain-containing protein 2 n=1 Tax=Cacopsylla melanoneura TaxID=428564 RepID=A0A8D8Y1G1_9HEMI